MYIDFLSQMCYTVCRLNSVTDMCKRCEIPTSKTKQKKNKYRYEGNIRYYSVFTKVRNMTIDDKN